MRCAVPLTAKTHDKTGAKRNQFCCKACVAETVRYTRDKEKQRDYDLLRKYAITLTEYEEILAAQNGACWICHKVPLETHNRLSVDHKHEKGEKRYDTRKIRERVRGLLCWPCNKAIAYLRDLPENAARAAEYLASWPAQSVLNPKPSICWKCRGTKKMAYKEDAGCDVYEVDCTYCKKDFYNGQNQS